MTNFNETIKLPSFYNFKDPELSEFTLFILLGEYIILLYEQQKIILYPSKATGAFSLDVELRYRCDEKIAKAINIIENELNYCDSPDELLKRINLTLTKNLYVRVPLDTIEADQVHPDVCYLIELNCLPVCYVTFENLDYEEVDISPLNSDRFNRGEFNIKIIDSFLYKIAGHHVTTFVSKVTDHQTEFKPKTRDPFNSKTRDLINSKMQSPY